MYEFKTVSNVQTGLLTQPVSGMLTGRMNADFAEINQTHNYCFSAERLHSGTGSVNVVWQIPDDYYYHLNGIRIFYNLTEQGDYFPSPYFSLQQVERNRRQNDIDIPFRVITNPAEVQNWKYRLAINHTFLPAGKIWLKFWPQLAAETTYYLLTEGMRIPKDFRTVI